MDRTTCSLELLSSNVQQIDQVIADARNAHDLLMGLKDTKIDAMISTIAERVLHQANHLAVLEVQETKMGNAADKVHKLGIVCRDVLIQLLGVKTCGRLDETQDGIVEFASPVGVVFGIVPSTNPVPNSLFKVLLCLKTRNALILSFPKTVNGLADELLKVVTNTLLEFDMPLELIQHLHNPDKSLVQEYLRHRDIDLVLATGGSALVKEAHSSGNPCYGVGPGNVPVYISADADIKNATSQIIESKSYDNGIICGSESNLIVEESVYDLFVESLIQQRAAVLNPEEKGRAIKVWFREDGGGLRRDLLGLSAIELAKRAEIYRDYAIQVHVIPAQEEEAPLIAIEKLAPVLTLFRNTENEATNQCIRLLNNHGGAGHTAVIHTANRSLAERFANAVPAGRVLVNTPATFGMMGVTTNLPVAFMLGSGTWGGNITTDAITWRHLVNVKRLAWGTNRAF